MYAPVLSSLLLSIFLLETSLANPIVHQKRYDLDGNGTPDICSVDDTGTAHCMLSDGSWTAFPATNTGFRAIAKTPQTKTKDASTVVKNVFTSAKIISKTASKTTYKASPATALPTGNLPAPAQFAADKGKRWSVTYIGDLQYTNKLHREKLLGDKCRTSKLGDRVIWNCGDMMCTGGLQICGFNMGPAFYGTDSVMIVNTTSITNVQENNFVSNWPGDPNPVAPQNDWGMDTSNIAAINSTHGIAYAWEIWRGANDGSFVDCGNAVVAVTLGATKPIATRMGPLLTGPDAIQMGLLAILRVDKYIYTYSIGGPSNIIIGRVPADDSAFQASKYEFLAHGSSKIWTSGIPNSKSTTIGATTANVSGQFACAMYGSVFHSNYLNKYVIICNIYLNYVNMYTSHTPYGPWSAEYQLMHSGSDQKVSGSYGTMVHVEYAPGGSDREVYFSMGPNSVFNMFKIKFDY